MKTQGSNLRHHPLNTEIYSLSDIDDLVGSIKEVGLLQALVIDQKNRVISGNRRLVAIKKLGLKSVEVEKIKVSEKDVGHLLVHHNKQRLKTNQELLNEYHILNKHYSVGQGKRSDLNGNGKGYNSRELISNDLGISSSQIGRLVFIEKEDKELINLIDKGILTVAQAYLLGIKTTKRRRCKV